MVQVVVFFSYIVNYLGNIHLRVACSSKAIIKKYTNMYYLVCIMLCIIRCMGDLPGRDIVALILRLEVVNISSDYVRFLLSKVLSKVIAMLKFILIRYHIFV